MMTLRMILVLLIFLSQTVDGFRAAGHYSTKFTPPRTCRPARPPQQICQRSLCCAAASDRRSFVQDALAWASSCVPFVVLSFYPNTSALAAPSASVDSLQQQIKQARLQLSDVPDLIRAEQWDSVRAILIKPPLSDCWTKSAKTKPLLQEYAEAVGEAGGDELAVLELKEEASSHLRFLDMAVYNNVFNPIKSEGTTGASKELVRSYYEDPLMEYKASVSALDELIKLGTE